MKKRLRKKKRLGEFQELGFQLSLRFRKNTTCDQIEQFHTHLWAAADALGLDWGGGSRGGEFHAYVTRRKGSVSKAEMDAMLTFAVCPPIVEAFAEGKLTDAWYGPFGQLEIPRENNCDNAN